MTTVKHVMIASPVSIPSSEEVWTAIDLVQKHGLHGLIVVEGDCVVGMVTPLQLLRQPLYRTISEVMRREITPAAPNLSLAQAHVLLTLQHLDVLPVVEDRRLLGMISLTAVLEASAQEIDPLTGLPWSTVLRAWAGDFLARGHEAAILFIDLDNFHMVNTALGHVAGDEVLRAIARLLSESIDPSTDVLCRYGGDEFAIATIRSGAAVNALAERIRETVVVPVEMDETKRSVTVSVGVAGGRRVETRASAHIAATVEDLLTLASRGSTLAKGSGQGVVHHTPFAEEEARQRSRPVDLAERRLRLGGVTLNTSSGRCNVSVELTLGGRMGVGTATRRTHGRGLSFLVAEATLQAITQTLGEEYAFMLEDLVDIPWEDEVLIVAVLSTSAGTPERFVGAARGRDFVHAVPKAILSALNRWLTRSAGELPLSLGNMSGAPFPDRLRHPCRFVES